MSCQLTSPVLSVCVCVYHLHTLSWMLAAICSDQTRSMDKNRHLRPCKWFAYVKNFNFFFFTPYLMSEESVFKRSTRSIGVKTCTYRKLFLPLTDLWWQKCLDNIQVLTWGSGKHRCQHDHVNARILLHAQVWDINAVLLNMWSRKHGLRGGGWTTSLSFLLVEHVNNSRRVTAMKWF